MQEIPQALGEADHPLAHRHVREDMLDEMRRPLQEKATRKLLLHQSVQHRALGPATGQPAVPIPATVAQLSIRMY
jgi:hypothetical protein